MSLGASLHIGQSALAAYQTAIATTGQNIANIGNPSYVRQSGHLAAQRGGVMFGGLSPGGGVRLDTLRRHSDNALENRLRQAAGAAASADATYTALRQTEALYNELTDADVSSLLGEFFAQFSTLETNPTDSGARNLVVSSASQLAAALQRQRSGLVAQVEELNQSATELANHAASLTEQIAELNAEIVTVEGDGISNASALRDRRDALLRNLSEVMDIQVREHDNGSINVFVGSEPLVEFDRARSPVVSLEIEDGLEKAIVRFSDNGARVRLSSGKLHGVLDARDRYITDQVQRLDTLARGLIYEVNRIQTSGVGTAAYTTLQSEHPALDPNAPLNLTTAGLPFAVSNGVFEVKVRDKATGETITRQIEVDLDGIDADTSLKDIAAQLNNVPNLNASVGSDGRLNLSSDADHEFWLAEDSSGLLAAIGMGGFFEGTNAADIRVASRIENDPRLIATSLSGEVEDGTNAGRFAALAQPENASDILGGKSIGGYHDSLVVSLATEANEALIEQDAADTVYQALYAQREAISGVSLDEEAINLSKYETAYQGAARYLSVVDSLMGEIMGLL